MTVTATTRRTGPFTGTGALVSYPFTFKVFAATDVGVTVADTSGVETTLVKDSTFLVTINPDQDTSPGGSVQYAVAGVATALPAGYLLVVTGDALAFEQSTDLPTGGSFDPTAYENALDKLAMQIQVLRDGLNRASTLPKTASGSAELPAPAASKLLGWDVLGTSLVNYDQPGTAGVALADLQSTASGKGLSLVGLNDAANKLAAANGEAAIAELVGERPWVNVKQHPYLAKGDGSTDDTAAIQAAINSFGSGNGLVYFPPGTYKTTSTLTVAQDRVGLRGAGPYATQILFAPTANGSCLKISKVAASVIYQCSVRSMGFYSNDSTFTKVAIEVVDHSSLILEDIDVAGSVNVSGSNFWRGGAGNGSVGLQLKGREAGMIRGFKCYADTPIQISDNPNHSIDIDHHTFRDLYLASANVACILVDTGVNLTNVTFDGHQAWVLGQVGFKWVDTTSAQASQNLVISGRTEQGTSATSYSIQIERNATFYGLTIRDFWFDPGREGIKLRNITNVAIERGLFSQGTGRTVVDVDSTVAGLTFTENYFADNGSANFNGQTAIWRAPNRSSAAPLPPSGRWQSSTVTDKNPLSDASLPGWNYDKANGAVATLGTTSMAGTLMVVDDRGLVAHYSINGTNNTTTEQHDVGNVYTPTKGSATSTNIYWSAGNARYELENNTGATRKYRVSFHGTFTSLP